MDHESVQSGGHRCIGCWFEHGRGEDPGPVPVAVGCERLRGGDVLAVDVGHGGGFDACIAEGCGYTTKQNKQDKKGSEE